MDCQQNKNIFSVIMTDIDSFKKINDTFGHDCGDHVLKMVSQTLQDAVREQDFVSRWGGEEFLLLLPETEIEDACILVNGIKKIITSNIREPYESNFRGYGWRPPPGGEQLSTKII